ncbi:hypothetical protein APICC_02911 [Apis cerana cerana]|uniref:Uncharacterized protein n=1 Tax=Apis cerana cerana TaxID=94128 RepID=A0A2A3EEE6_APICC|nr:hypothetical protein APICC_02911 [Apis cerana cerana]
MARTPRGSSSTPAGQTSSTSRAGSSTGSSPTSPDVCRSSRTLMLSLKILDRRYVARDQKFRNNAKKLAIDLLVLETIVLYHRNYGGKEEHGRHRHRERMIPTFAGNTVGGSMWTLDYIKVRSGCSCEIMPKLKKKKKYKKSKPRDQDLDPET